MVSNKEEGTNMCLTMETNKAEKMNRKRVDRQDKVITFRIKGLDLIVKVTVRIPSGGV